MKKSSLGRRSSSAQSQRIGLSEFESARKKSAIPVRSRASSADRNTSFTSTSTLKRSKSNINLRLEVPTSTPYENRRLTGGIERPPRIATMSTGSKRCSSYGGTKSRRDNRPLQDKEWQMNALRKIEDVIRSIPDGLGMFKNSIKPLSIKLFVEITDLLLSNLDRTITITNANYTSEIPFLSKLMLYKGKIDKSWLISVNTQHAFTYALGFLHFLASCYQGQNQVDPISLMYPENFCGNSKESWNFKIMLPYFHKSYELFLNNDPDRQELQNELDNQVLSFHFHDKDHVIHQLKCLEHENMKQMEENSKKKAYNQSLTTEINELTIRVNKLMEEEKMQDDLTNLIESEIHSLEKEIAQLKVKEESLEATLEQKNDILDNVRKEIDVQQFSQQDIKQIREKCISLQRDIESEGNYVEEYENQIFQEDIAIMNLQKELQTVSKNYMLLLEEVIEDPSEITKFPRNVQDLNPEVIDDACFFLDELKAKLIPNDKVESLQENRAKIEQLNNENSKLQSECDSVEKKINIIKDETSCAINEHTKKIFQLNADLEAVSEKRTHLTKNMPESYDDLVKKQTIIAKEMDVELKEYKKRTKLILTERKKIFEEYKQKIWKLFHIYEK